MDTKGAPAQLRVAAVRQGRSDRNDRTPVGHSTTSTTERVYRKQIRPVIEDGAIVMDQLFRDRNEGT
ncbi:hypothetical protein [Thermocrispum municipale]|uniref:hypothetical protein n=1 Tax=Thermocrispum municipale TaxID=37926 RepID=UPI0003FFE67A|nr:hypothetical protein [Thermocrispum municipale]